ncbi:hypothetical protein P59_257 [Bacillus phage P59]|nr:hypothetical protein P59_028 [Bacillus phage P59]QIW88854.1 hypothetical protein P59_257 [Bacillus phage P59]
MTEERYGLLKTCTVCHFDSVYEEETCEHCDSTGYEPIPDNQMVYVNVYSVTRHYGGPEEGGWYYDWMECIEVFPCRNMAAGDMLAMLTDENEHKKWGDIYSVLGGRDIVIQIEETPKESETKERPYYE